MNKQFYFLSGIPRAGNTLLSTILNQNKNIKVSPNTILCDVLLNLYNVKDIDIYKNFPNEKYFNNIYLNVFNNYYQDLKSKVIIDRGPWGTPGNLYLLKKIFKKPKFIILIRPILECIASFIDIEKPKNINERIDNLLNKGIIYKYLWSIENILKNEKHVIIDYNELILNTEECLKKIHKFINVEYTKYNLKNLKQYSLNNLTYNDEAIDGNLHKIKPFILPTKRNIEDILPKKIINNYKNICLAIDKKFYNDK
jgi:hypothetical protein